MTTDDVVHGEIRVKQKKTGKELWIPLHPALKTAFLGVSGPLLANGKGEAFSTGTFRDLRNTELARKALKPIRMAGLVPARTLQERARPPA